MRLDLAVTSLTGVQLLLQAFQDVPLLGQCFPVQPDDDLAGRLQDETLS